jgi:outer membrane protein
MFSKITTKIATIAIAATASVFAFGQFAGNAEAEGETKSPIILIVDQTRVLATSTAGQSISEQMRVLQDTVNKELETQVATLVKEGEELKAKQGKMEEKAYLEAAKKIAFQQQNMPVLREVRIRELSLSEQQAFGQVSEKLRPILEEIVKERGATVLLDRSAVMYGATETDITQEVIDRLNEQITTVKVQRVSLQQQAARQ